MEAFRFCASLQTLSFGENLALIQKGAFTNCKELTEVRFAKAIEIGERVFPSETKLLVAGRAIAQKPIELRLQTSRSLYFLEDHFVLAVLQDGEAVEIHPLYIHMKRVMEVTNQEGKHAGTLLLKDTKDIPLLKTLPDGKALHAVVKKKIDTGYLLEITDRAVYDTQFPQRLHRYSWERIPVEPAALPLEGALAAFHAYANPYSYCDQ